MSNGDFKAGDIVRLKSGGPPMTVLSVETKLTGAIEVTCQYFFGSMIETKTFRPVVLKAAEPASLDELRGYSVASSPPATA